MSKTFIGGRQRSIMRVRIRGASGKRNVRPCRISCKQFSFQMCLESGDVSNKWAFVDGCCVLGKHLHHDVLWRWHLTQERTCPFVGEQDLLSVECCTFELLNSEFTCHGSFDPASYTPHHPSYHNCMLTHWHGDVFGGNSAPVSLSIWYGVVSLKLAPDQHLWR